MMLIEDRPPVSRNESRMMLAAGVLALAALSLLSGILAYFLIVELSREGDVDRLGAFSDPVILNRVPNVDGPAARQGEVISYRQERCAVQATTIETTTFYRTDGQQSVPGETLKTDIAKGCYSPPQQLAMPKDVQPGFRWQVNGIVRDRRSGEVRYWTSQAFMVVP